MMDIKPTMSKFGFGHRAARHIVIERDGELWLAAAPSAVGGFLPMGATSLPGTLRLEPISGGKRVPFTYRATEALLELTTETGALVSLAIDKGAQAVRITGNTAFRLNGVESAAFVTTLNTGDGVIISVGAIRYLFTAKKGKITFDDAWILNQFHSVTPVLEIEPENGAFELCAYDLPADTDAPAITKTLQECAAENCADFRAFVDTLVDIPAEWSDIREKIAYPLWLCHRVLEAGKEVIVENKYNSAKTSSTLMSIASMAFKDAARAADMLVTYPAEPPLVAAVAAARLLEENMLCDSRGEIYRVYESLETAARKCVKERTADMNGLCFYAYRFESGEERSPEFFKAGGPVLAPDLNAYLIILCEVIGRLAAMEYDDGAGQKWTRRARELKAQLVAQLWDGEDFIGRNAYTGESCGPDKSLSLVPIVLGNRLPEEIVQKLAKRIDAKAADSATGFLLARGLCDAGEKTAAREIAVKAMGSVRENGISCPFYGASLLALAHKVM
jgi:hypothetical protein